MVYQFQIISPESNNFCLRVEIDGNHSFYKLHETIQKSIDYQQHQLASFFITDSSGKKQREVSLLDSGVNGFPNFSMYRTKLSDLITPVTKRLYYSFDLFNDRSFYLELTGIFMENNLNEPLVTLKQGDSPTQVFNETVQEKEVTILQEDDVLQDFGVLEDYTEIFGEMEDL